MTGGKVLEQLEITLRDIQTDSLIKTYFDIYDNSLSRKWLIALNHLLENNYYLEKNYCFFGFADGPRNGQYILDQINRSITAINNSDLDYKIQDHFTLENSVDDNNGVNHEHFNHLHRYFEDLQGVSGSISPFYVVATPETRWHIRQLNLLCHEFESWQLSWKKKLTAPDWQRPSQLMCWLNAPRFMLDEEDYELFGIETINRSVGSLYVGVNKAVGKHHWEVFNDEGRDSRIDELTTSTLRSQTEAAGDFDIEWGRNPGEFDFQKRKLAEFRQWLIDNGFDPDDQSLTIGHPQIGQCDLVRSFGTEDFRSIWAVLNTHLDVYSVKTSNARAEFDYHWSDPDFVSNQIKIIEGN